MNKGKAFKNTVMVFYTTLILTAISWPLQAAEPKELAFFTWSDYLDPLILKEFKHRTGITVKQTYFESAAARDELLIRTGGRGFDVVLVDGASVRVLAKRGWLEPVNETDIPNLKHIDPRWRTIEEKTEAYSVPYLWGTLGIAYRQDLVSFDVSSWMDMLRPVDEMYGQLAMINDARDLIGVALKALGYSLNSTETQELKDAEALLQGQAQWVKTYKYVSRDENSALVNGQVSMSMMYNGDFVRLQKYHRKIAFVVPKEGSNIWIDHISLLSASTNKASAKQFINFLNEPKIAAQISQFTYFATPNVAAEALLPEDFRNNPLIYPSEEALKNLEMYQRLPARTQKIRAAIFSRLVN